MTATQENKHELLRQEVVPFFEKAERYGETQRSKFAAWVGVNCKEAGDVFSDGEWGELRDEWLRRHLRKAMTEVFKQSIVREQFNITQILAVFRVERKEFKRAVGTEWRALAKNLPTLREKVLADLAHLVEINFPAKELTGEMLFERLGYAQRTGAWISIPLRAAKIELAARQAGNQVDPPVGDNIRVFPGGYVDLDSFEWDLNLKKGLIRRNCLRPDVADVAWPLLKEDIRERRIALSTVGFNYRCFITAGIMLGAEVPEVRAATLEAVQRAWINYASTRHNYSDARAALVRIFISLHSLAEGDSSVERDEMLKITAWLKTKAKLPRKESGGKFLSESELSQVITSCLMDIKAGMEFVETSPSLVTMSTRVQHSCNAAPVVNWAVALMVLVMAFTGMRRQSVVGLRLNDWMQVRSELFAIAWKHSKNGEEGLAVTPALVTGLLDTYVRHTESVRTALGTKRVFLTGTLDGVWTRTMSNTAFYGNLSAFVKRHGILRDGKLIRLNSTVLRRTYASHQLCKGRSLEWIRTQLGHKKIENTKSYAQFDVYEHPAQVRGPLDAWGQRVLGLWHRPTNFEDYTIEERVALFSGRESSPRGELFPDYDSLDTHKTWAHGSHVCSTCEHLVTGPQYVDQWERERAEREAHLKSLESDHPRSNSLEAELEAYGHFMKNYERVKEGSGE